MTARSWLELSLLALALGCDRGAPDVSTPTEDGGVPDAGIEAPPAPCTPSLSGEGTLRASGLSAIRRLAADSEFLYLTETQLVTASTGRLLRVPLAGGGVAEVAREFTAPDALAVDETSVFVADSVGLWRVAKSDGAKSSVDLTVNNARFGGTELFLTDSQVVYATASRFLVRVGKDGSGRTVLFAGPQGTVVRSAVVEGAEVYFLVSAHPEPGLYRVPLDGSTPAVRVRAEPVDGRALLLTPLYLYWADESKVVRAPRGGGEVEVLATGLSGPGRLAVLDEVLYLKDSTVGQPASDHFFQRVLLCAPGEAKPVGPVGVGAGDLVKVGGSLFFTSQAGGGQGYLSSVP